MSTKTRDALSFPESQKAALLPYLPPSPTSPSTKPLHVTLTFATSLDSSLALAPGTQTHLSGPASKAMTHFLRSRHDAILIGVGTAMADNPSLNCRLEGVGGYGGEGLVGQPRPVVLDPRGRWEGLVRSKVLGLARERRGRALWVVSWEDGGERGRVLEECGGRWIQMGKRGGGADVDVVFDWEDVLRVLQEQGIRSVMIEGGGRVINDLLGQRNFAMVDSVIVTIAPTWLGRGGVLVCPEERREDGVKVPVGKLRDVTWVPLGEDAVVCGRPKVG